MFLALIPWWGRLLAVIALLGGIWGHGAYTGNRWEKGKFDALQAEYTGFKASVKATGDAQEAKTAKIIADQKEITKNAAQTYAGKLAALKRDGVRLVNPGGGEIAQLSCGPARTDGTATDALPPVAAVPEKDFTELAGLAAQTTLQLLGLQQWIREQQAAWK